VSFEESSFLSFYLVSFHELSITKLTDFFIKHSHPESCSSDIESQFRDEASMFMLKPLINQKAIKITFFL
jgi:hypothetical protein